MMMNLKHLAIFLIAFLFLSCAKENFRGPSTEPGDEAWGTSNLTINARIFEVVNLDYPGLEKAKAFYEAEEHGNAVKAILEYYRMRTGIVNPATSLINTTASEDDKLKANFALDSYRFFVNNYFEDANAKMPYSLNEGGAINWAFEPSGADNEYQRQLHRHQWFVPQAKVYRVTKDEKHIQSWIHVYRDWLENNPKPASGTNNTTWWQLQVAERTLGQTQLFEYYKNSINFTPEWLTEFMVYFAEHADFLVEYPYSGGNILISQASALVSAGVLFPEFKHAEEWRNTGFQILDNEVKNQFLEDGMHIELDFSYHISAVADFYEIMKLAEANKNIVGNAATNFNQFLHKAAEVVMHFTYPNYFTNPPGGYLVPGFNDTRQSSWTRSVLNRNFIRYNEMFPQDNELLYMGTYGQRGTQPSTDPKAFLSSGYYVLRNGWERSSTMLIHSNNYAEGPIQVWSHNQPDNGTFELYHNGRNFFPDAGVYAYMSDGDNSAREWFQQTRSHNTMTFNEQNIVSALGKSRGVFSNDQQEVVVTENQGYNNFKHRRYIFFVEKKFFVLVDEGIGEAAGTVNLNFHLCEGEDEVVVSTGQHGAHTNFADGNNILARTFGNGTLTTTPFEGRVSYAPGVMSYRKAYTVNMSKAANETARYITVLYPDNQVATTQISADFNGSYQDSGVSVDVVINGQTYNLSCNL